MPKKMHDILPPKLANKVKDTVISPAPKKSKIPSTPARVRKPRPQAERSFSFKKIFFIWAGLALVVLGALAYIKLPKADIEIWPKMDAITLQQKVTANTGATAVDQANNIIPARYVEVLKEASQEFPATGIASADGKATGTIRVYNKLDSAFTLIKGTHFLSDSGKYFVTTVKVVIPGAKTVSGKSQAGYIDTSVEATEVGTDYNIGSSKFSIPKLNGTTYYYSIYGESTRDMVGGHVGKVKKVTSDDIFQAKEILTKKTLQDSKDDLKGKLLDDEILLDGATENSVIDAVCDVAVDTIKDSFTETVKVKAFGLAFKKQDLETLQQNKIAGQLSKDKDFLKNSLGLSYTPSSVDIKGGKLALNVTSSAKTYENIDINNFIDLLGDKTADQIQSTIGQIYEGDVTKTKVDFWPFWVSKSPKDQGRIKVHINF